MKGRKSAFTLIEILIAITIISGIAGLVAEATRRTFILRDNLQKRAEASQIQRIVHYSLSRDLKLALNLERPAKETKSEEEGRKNYGRLKTFFRGSKTGFLFTTTSHRRLYLDSPESEVAIIEYKFDKSEEFAGASRLIKREKIFLDEKPEEGGATFDLADNLGDSQFLYYNEKENQWEEVWDSTNKQSGIFPAAIKAALKFKKNDKESPYSAVILLENPVLEEEKKEKEKEGETGKAGKEEAPK